MVLASNGVEDELTLISRERPVVGQVVALACDLGAQDCCPPLRRPRKQGVELPDLQLASLL